ncbi:MAG: ROK family transcriptional regulator [Anaerolineae bacterium]|nr:ROK family transcriptional regulator [Anaerolineae bacterium]
MKSRKTTHGQLKRENRQLLLRAVYTGLASSRAELAQEIGLSKPTVSDLIGELIREGFLIETGLGQSTDEGGKRPRLLEFVPEARHVIGVSVSAEQVLGVLTHLDGRILVEHYKDVEGVQGQALIDSLCEVINGLIAQLSAPLLCMGIGVPGLVNTQAGIVRYAPHLGWQDVNLAETLSVQYQVPVYVANNTELAAMAQYAFGAINGANSLAMVLVNDSVGVGAVLDGAVYHSGSEIGYLRIGQAGLESFVGWQAIRQKAAPLADQYLRPLDDDLTYLHIRQAVADSHPLALALQDELADHLAQVFAWVIALLRPDHLSLAGTVADMGDSLLDCIIEKTRALILPDLVQSITFSLDNSPNLVAVGAVAQALQHELGLV